MDEVMNYVRQHPLAVALIAVGFVVLTIIAFALNSPGNGTKNSPGHIVDPFQTTTLDSPFTKTSENFAVNYVGGGDPNRDAVQPQYSVFGLSNLAMPQAIKDILPDRLKQALWATAVPTYASSYVQIDRSTLKCDTQYDCQFSFYLDSPESYYDFHLYVAPSGTYTSTIKPMPLPGASQ